jgi:cytochrome P450
VTALDPPMADFDDLLSDDAVNRPWKFLAELREHEPVYFNRRWNGWIVTRYGDVIAGFRDHERLSSARFEGPFAEEWQAALDINDLLNFLSKWLVWQDPPEHKRVRSLLSKAFTARSIENLRGRIDTLVEGLVEPLRGRDDVRFIEEFAFHLPVIVIGDYLGIPSGSHHLIKQWSDDLGAVIFVRGNDEARLHRAEQAVQELAEFLRPIVAERRRDPQDDLISAMVHAEEAGGFLSEDDVIANVILMVFAGHETTMNLLANGVVAFDRNPAEWARFQTDPPGLARTTVEEILRYDGPIHAMARWARVDLEIGGQAIAAGERILLHQTAANHDPEAFENPDELDIGRWPNPHLGLGQGIHTCLGGPLARVEAQEAFKCLASVFDRVEIVDQDLAYNPTIVSRSLRDLRVRFVER